VIIGANRKTNPSTIKKANEKFSLLLRKGSLFLKNKIRGTIIRKVNVDKDASTRLKFRTFKAEEVSEKNKLI